MAVLLRAGLNPQFCSAALATRAKRGCHAIAAQLASRPAGDEFFQTDSRPIMLFDGLCNLCNGGVRFVRKNGGSRRMRFEPLQSDGGRKLLQRSGRSPDDISSVVLVEVEGSHIKSEAVIKIMEYLDSPYPQLGLLLKKLPLFLRDFAYDNVANNRYAIFGRSETSSCEI